MLEFPRWKYILVALVLLFSAFYALPNLYPQDPAVQIAGDKSVTIDSALASRVQGMLQASHIPFKKVAVEGSNVIVRVADTDTQIKAETMLSGGLGNVSKGYTVALNLAPTVPSWLVKIGGKPMTLGLDLQGGVHFLMQVDQASVREKRENQYADEARAALRDKQIRFTDISRSADGVIIQLKNTADKAAALSVLSQDLPKLKFTEAEDGLSLHGAVSAEELKKIADNAIEQNVNTLRNRINGMGVAEPVIQRQGSDRIVVQLPGVQDTAKAKDALGGTSTLEYRAVIDGNALEAARTGNVPPEARIYYMRELGPGGQRIPILLSKRVIVSGDQLVDATPGFDQQSGRPDVSIKLDSAGGKRMFDHTLENVGKRMAVVFIERKPTTHTVDGKEVRSVEITQDVLNAATIQGVFGKDFHTTGLDPDEASKLAEQLKAGALAAPVDIVEERVIGPSLGRDNIEAGRKAVTLGFLLVCALMIFYYRGFGMISVAALLINLILLIACLSVLGATMTMPGIAGIVLTLGMSIDGNVLICERIREELRLGNSPISSIKTGYERAWTVILDANVAKVISALALFSFGSGPVRGFALVLLFGVVTSVFTSVTVSRALSTLVYGHGRKVKRISVGGGF
jgi:preprotein translocase subunit SecD